MFRKAYDLAFTRGNICKGFKKTGRGPSVLKGSSLVLFLKFFDDLNTIVSVDELSKIDEREKGG